MTLPSKEKENKENENFSLQNLKGYKIKRFDFYSSKVIINHLRHFADSFTDNKIAIHRLLVKL